jgi:hypothetical protein
MRRFALALVEVGMAWEGSTCIRAWVRFLESSLSDSSDLSEAERETDAMVVTWSESGVEERAGRREKAKSKRAR